MAELDMECCVDEIVENVIKSLQLQVFISPAIFCFTEESVYILDTDNHPEVDKALEALDGIHRKLNGKKWIDIFVSQCKINNSDEILDIESEEGRSAVLLIPITSDNKTNKARVLPFDNSTKRLMLYPEKEIELDTKSLKLLLP